jgi:hypothetical protein
MRQALGQGAPVEDALLKLIGCQRYQKQPLRQYGGVDHMCFLLTLIFLGPRVGILFWWLLERGRWDAAFDSVLWPILGFILLPWTTLMFVAVAPFGNVEGWDWFWLGLALLGDLVSISSNAYGSRGRIPGYA